MRTDEQALVDRLPNLAQEEDKYKVREQLENVRPEDLADAIQRSDFEIGLAILRKLDAETAAYVLVELPDDTSRSIIAELPDTTVAHYLDILPMDDALDLRDSLSTERFEALLHVIPDQDAQEIRRLLSYPENSAGQLMTEDYVEVAPTDTMSDVLNLIRNTNDEEFETVNYIYVLSEDRHLLGLLTLKRVIRAQPNALARDVMSADIITVNATMPEEEVARVLARYGFSAVPVLDDRGRMLGIITADDAQEILEEAQTEDVLMLGGVTGDAENYLALSIVELVKRRLPWLVVLFVAEFLTGSVLRHYLGKDADDDPSASLAIIAKLQLFVPLLIGAGGNAGSQVTTTITRALALGDVRSRDWFRVIRREFSVALIIGATLGLIGFARVALPVIGWSQPLYFSLTVALSLPCIILWAATVGSVLPIAAKRFGIDPAVMSAPFISTFVDATGLIIYFEVAHRVMTAFGKSF
ncbi:MAG: magnesium transporter [Armatimonadetes bacterium]|nr:magnesium transporter [Armatimonadota bacterium]MBS1701645.1 magnesium transporter [Armatimonadota bacterium]MBS1727290.1 magnesium transporter [Armatimonadota bacterium]